MVLEIKNKKQEKLALNGQRVQIQTHGTITISVMHLSTVRIVYLFVQEPTLICMTKLCIFNLHLDTDDYKYKTKNHLQILTQDVTLASRVEQGLQ